MTRRVVITGLGSVAPGSIGVPAFWKLLVNGESATRAITHFDASAYRSRIAAEVDFDPELAGLSPQEVVDFQDYIMWRLVGLSAAHELPFQIHTGHGKLQGSNPLLLLDLIEANPRTKFVLFHGGYPWVGETGAIVLRHGRHVWVDSVWLPTISPTLARRALHEWLEVMPSDRILWGADGNHAEGI